MKTCYLPKPSWNFDLLTFLPQKGRRPSTEKRKENNIREREKKNLEIGHIQRNQKIRNDITSCSKHK